MIGPIPTLGPTSDVPLLLKKSLNSKGYEESLQSHFLFRKNNIIINDNI